jgi:hypothetical protein
LVGFFEDVAGGPGLKRLKQVVRVVVYAQQEDTDLWVPALDLSGCHKAVHLGHPHVHEDQLGAHAATQLERFAAV